MSEKVLIKKKKIMQAATVLFAQHGYDGTSISDIMANANVTKSLLYYNFKNKEFLYKEIIENYLEEIKGFLALLPGGLQKDTDVAKKKEYYKINSFYLEHYNETVILLNELLNSKERLVLFEKLSVIFDLDIKSEKFINSILFIFIPSLVSSILRSDFIEITGFTEREITDMVEKIIIEIRKSLI